ncbi:hypothetical protein GN109_25315 [Collimonas pratensis]|uniref:hypothetical protein n=1 Tax=Collimonas pratensis TaxID=279113 RepID=UPI00143D6678|nr:hypothetical protein [Collimonas pratensis]NKI72744.1 hypothetical protein [Collimonas pratensis]
MKKFVRTLLKFWKIRGIAVVVFSALLSQPAYSFTPLKYSGDVKVSFSKNSSIPSDSVKITLARHLPRLFSLHLEMLIIITDGDTLGSGENSQVSLAEARGRALRQFFVDAGVPGDKIYTTTRLTSQGNTSELEYVGTCVGGDTTCPYCVSEDTLICK